MPAKPPSSGSFPGPFPGPSPGWTVPGDDPFLERLFGAMCRNLSVLPGESFVDQVRMWMNALRFAASLKPRDEQEWLRAADVTVKQSFAVYSLVQRKRLGITAKQRQKYGHDFLLQAKALRDARLRYDLLRKAGSG